jgi:drug/metabolite transporter (DMT)-like permease
VRMWPRLAGQPDSGRWFFVGCCCGWGSAGGRRTRLGKIATETGHGPFGLIFWQQVVMVAVLGAIALVRRKGIRLTGPALRFYVIVAVLGTLIPNGTFYASVAHLPSGVMSIIIATIPMLAFPMALALGMDRFSALRLVGLVMGLAGVALLAAPGRRCRMRRWWPSCRWRWSGRCSTRWRRPMWPARHARDGCVAGDAGGKPCRADPVRCR